MSGSYLGTVKQVTWRDSGYLTSGSASRVVNGRCKLLKVDVYSGEAGDGEQLFRLFDSGGDIGGVTGTDFFEVIADVVISDLSTLTFDDEADRGAVAIGDNVTGSDISFDTKIATLPTVDTATLGRNSTSNGTVTLGFSRKSLVAQVWSESHGASDHPKQTFITIPGDGLLFNDGLVVHVEANESNATRYVNFYYI